MDIIYLSREQVEGLAMSMAEVMAAVDNGLRLKGLGLAEMPPKPGIHPRADAFIHAMPAYIKEIEAAGLKWVSGYPTNPEKDLPYITGLLILNDADTGVPICVMDCSWITAMRTGASAGISAKYLARPGSSTVGFLGCGVQARTSLMALVEVLPELSRVRCSDLYPEAAGRFVAQMSARFPQLEFVICGDAVEMMQGADVVVSAIPIVEKPNPPLGAGMLKEGGLAISLDYDSAWTSAAVAECDRFCSDDVGQLLDAKAHGPHFSGVPSTIWADLGELAAGLRPGRENDQERIFSMNMGIAIEDMATARVLYRRAMERGAGTRLPL